MRLTLRATRVALVVISISLFGQVTATAAGEQVLDLTKAPPSERRSMGGPGGFMGGTAGGVAEGDAAGREEELPVRLKIKTLDPIGNSSRAVLRLEILNIGGLVLKVPSCLDTFAAFPAGAHDRRSLNFGLMLNQPGTAESRTSFVEVTSTSDSAPKCVTLLKPGAALLVVLNVEIPTISRLGGDEKNRALMRVFLEEWRFDDARYAIKLKIDAS